MMYAKPEINVLGDTASVIQVTGKGCDYLDPADPSSPICPDYDLDE